jgi:hypothetical protein
MSLAVIGFGIAFWAAAFLVHVVVWWIRRPADDLKVLGLIMGGLPLIQAGPALVMFEVPAMDLFFSILLSWSIGATYLFWYPAAQAASPTMLLCLLIGAKGKQGEEARAIKSVISGDLLTRETFHNLFSERFATLEGPDSVKLAPRGRRTLHVISALRALAGFKEPRG